MDFFLSYTTLCMQLGCLRLFCARAGLFGMLAAHAWVYVVQKQLPIDEIPQHYDE